MNHPQSYMETNQAHAPPPVPGHYTTYAHPQTLQPAAQLYASTYSQYPYPQTMAPMQPGHQVTTSMGGQMASQPLPTMQSNGQTPTPNGNQQFAVYDQTGQLAPAGMKPRVTATLWEDEGSLCFQVESNGVCVARREDNHMINGTKLLNVAGMTRGRRDGILKSEKTRHVVKIGPMHLKGVWIPFERALDFANKEKITERLYPLFVHNIGALLYHPANAARPGAGNASMPGRRPDQQQEYTRTPQGTQPPALTHHHSMQMPGANVSHSPHSLASYATPGRPGLDRARTFPTPPTSATSLTMGMGNAGTSYEYAAGHPASMHPGQPLHVETGMTTRSVPTTPATTPPGQAHGAQHGAQYHTSQSYEPSRQAMYSNYNGYPPQQGMGRYEGVHSSPGSIKTEMGPPTRGGAEHEHHDNRHHVAYGGHHEGEGEHEGEYTHTSASYGTAQPTYNYAPNTASGPMHPEHSHVSPEMTHSPHQSGSGRATPRTANPYQGYSTTPNRASQLPSSNLSYVMAGDPRGAPSGPTGYPGPDGYHAQPHYPSMNGAPPSNKRMRDMDEEADPYGRPMSAGIEVKRQRTDSGANRPIIQPQSVKAGGVRR